MQTHIKNFKLTHGFRSYLIQQINEMDLSEAKRVDIVPWGSKRGLPANALSHVFYDVIAKATGMNEVHSDCKIRFGLPILFARRDDYAFDVAEMLDAMDFWGMSLENQLRKIKPIAVTSKFKTKEMAQYIEDMQIFYGQQGIILESE